MKRVLALLVMVGVAHAAQPMRFTRLESPEREAPTFTMELRGGKTYIFETRNLSRGSDTVLVVLDDGTPIAWNDDRDRTPKDKLYPKESRVEFTPARPRWPYQVQVRAHEGSLPGECDLYMNGKLLAKKLKYGGPYKRAKGEPMPMPAPRLEPRPKPAPLPSQYDVLPGQRD